MQILKYLLVFAVFVFQIEFAQAGFKKTRKAKGKTHVSAPRSASYYKVSAKYFKTPKKTAKVANVTKSAKLKKSAKSKRSIASASAPHKLKMKKSKSSRVAGKKKFLR